MAILIVILGTHAVAQAQNCGQTVTGLVMLKGDLECLAGHGLVLANNATLDCAGYTLKGGDQSGQYGIYVRNASGAIVRNCMVEHFGVGIRLRQATNSVVHNNTSQHNLTYGIELSASTGALLRWNTVYNNSDEGIHVSGPSGDAAHHIEDNTVSANADEGIYLLNTHANTIARNKVQGHGTAGLYVKGSSRNTIDHNTFTNDPIQLVAGSQQNVLRNSNTITGQRIKFDGASNNEVYDMSIQVQGDRPSSAYEFNQSSGNRIVDSEAIDPVDYHIRAANNSKNNVFTRFLVEPNSPLRCFVDSSSSVTVTDPAGKSLQCN